MLSIEINNMTCTFYMLVDSWYYTEVNSSLIESSRRDLSCYGKHFINFEPTRVVSCEIWWWDDTCVVTTWILRVITEIVKSILHQIVIIIHSHCHYHPDHHSQPEQSGNSGLKNSSRSYSMLAILMNFTVSLTLIGFCSPVRVFDWFTDLARHGAKSATTGQLSNNPNILLLNFYSPNWIFQSSMEFWPEKHESLFSCVMRF